MGVGAHNLRMYDGWQSCLKWHEFWERFDARACRTAGSAAGQRPCGNSLATVASAQNRIMFASRYCHQADPTGNEV
eukprot:2309194-Pyramimonas_sp.AAC.1